MQNYENQKSRCNCKGWTFAMAWKGAIENCHWNMDSWKYCPWCRRKLKPPKMVDEELTKITLSYLVKKEYIKNYRGDTNDKR